MNIYPLKPVVTSNPRLTRDYNANLYSVFSISACLTSREAIDLLRSGAIFDSITLVNGEGEDLIAEMGDVENWDAEIMPFIYRTSITATGEKAVSQLHEVIMERHCIYGA
ncbi:MAG TPA: hypothetical protein VK138_11345 [Acidiferrobacterales bacterium]|nr:hypothetical protein [Acidiferrobacterales bacterium]